MKILNKIPSFLKSLTLLEIVELVIIIFTIIICIIFIFDLLFIGKPTKEVTPVGNYTCNGGIIKICTGSQKVYKYLGN